MTKNPDEIINHVKEYAVPVERVVHQPVATKSGNTIADILPSVFAALDLVSRELIASSNLPAVVKDVFPVALKAVRDEVTKP